MTDDKILDLYWGRDETAITESDKQYGKYCYSIAYRILSSHEDPEECVNETWLNAWQAIPPQRHHRWKCFFTQQILFLQTAALLSRVVIALCL